MAFVASDIVNQALQDIAAEATVSGTAGNFVGVGGTVTSEAQAANILYTATVEEVLREQDWEFALIQDAVLSATGGESYLSWSNAYAYPSDCLRVRSVHPYPISLLDPQPTTWSVGFVNLSTNKIILTNFPNALASYTTNLVTEADWDLGFQTTVVKLLASRIVMAVGGRPDFSKYMAEMAAKVGQESYGRDS